jgi:predicted site-specific integrase-resolvase
MAFETYDMDDLLNGKQAAAVANVRPQTICYWASKGYLNAQDGDGGRPRYRRGDVLDVERAMRRSPKSSRSTVRRATQRAA